MIARQQTAKTAASLHSCRTLLLAGPALGWNNLISIKEFLSGRGIKCCMHNVPQATAILFLLGLGLDSALAQDIAAGKQVARTLCKGCHDIANRPPPSLGLAPSFVKIANTKGMTQTSIQVFLSTSHEVMPNYSLSPKQIRDVAAYIMTLRKSDRDV